MQNVVLTEQEWNALCDRTYNEETDDWRCIALPICCANVSALRDQIIILRERDGVLLNDNRKDLLQSFEWVQDGHASDEWDWTILNKLIEQIKS